MGFLAHYIKSSGGNVSGSDIFSGDMVKALKKEGVKIYIGHKKKNLKEDCSMVIYNSAISLNNVELVEARRRKLLILSRAEVLGLITNMYKKSLLVAGSHGKTTTTAILHQCIKSAGFNPTTHIGGVMAGETNNFHIGEEIFIGEACEYKENFLELKSDYAIITNVDYDHPDYYATREDYYKAFKKFLKNTKVAIMKKESADLLFKGKLKKNIFTFGEKDADYVAKNIRRRLDGDGYVFSVIYNDCSIGRFKINTMSRHDIYNSLSVIALLHQLSVESEKIKMGLRMFRGVSGRAEKIGENIYRDYAHHPTEVKRILKDFSVVKGKNRLIVFQPHTYSRTKKYFEEFRAVFSKENVVFYETYSAREKVEEGYSADYIAKKLNKKYFKKESDLVKYINNVKKDIRYVLFLGAGDLNNNIVRHIRKKKIKV